LILPGQDGSGVGHAAKGNAMSENWEYKIIYVDAQRWTSTGLPQDLNQDFDAWGAEGWELVGTEAITRRGWGYGSSTAGIVAFFKRRTLTPVPDGQGRA
jgi:Domain of unknown function (DUF4177)